MDIDTKSKSDPKGVELFLAQVPKKRYKDTGTDVVLPKLNTSKNDEKEIDQSQTVRKVIFIPNSQPILGQYWLHLG